ncbi:hypothetical protein [Candidatus Poriferisodalis sp.]|uniref:hypothetical protein n=1 Tax=Candidatus Poriferisodalis sp. TaxID=3101277 RepID=UPI003B02D79A
MSQPGDDAPVPWALRKGVSTAITLAVFFAAACVVLAVWLSRGSDTSPTYPSGLQEVVPVPGAQVPRQSPIGARLDAGWKPTLVIGGTTIPAHQLDAGTTQLGEYFFAPGPGKVIEELRSGQTCARVTATLVIDVEAADLIFEWCFSTF